jgi:hypothetical protein
MNQSSNLEKLIFKLFYMHRFLFIFLITFAISKAQSIYRSDQHLLFKEAKTSQSVLILKDSLAYKGNPLKSMPFKHGLYLEHLNSYIPFTVGKKNYFVHSGCGPVLEWRNDSIVRIDQSFLHLNQINSLPFVYNYEIYFFGGYGLFTYKNLLTKYSFKTNEWDEIETFGTPPSPRLSAIGIVVEDDLYVFDGYEKDQEHFLKVKSCEANVYRLNLLSRKWFYVGKFDDKSNFNYNNATALFFNAHNKLYVIKVSDYNHVCEIDFKTNTIKNYKGTSKNIAQPYFDTNANEVVYLNKNADGLKSIMRTPLQEFLGKKVSQQAFILPWYQSLNLTTVIVVVLSAVLVLILMLYANKRKSRFVPFNGITFHATTSIFYYRGKPLDTLDDAELRILDYLVQNRHRFISLNELNHLYENEIQSDNFTTVVKRREVALSSLLAKLIFIMNSTEQDILVYRRSVNDKRVKEIKLKDSFIKVK